MAEEFQSLEIGPRRTVGGIRNMAAPAADPYASTKDVIMKLALLDSDDPKRTFHAPLSTAFLQAIVDANPDFFRQPTDRVADRLGSVLMSMLVYKDGRVSDDGLTFGDLTYDPSFRRGSDAKTMSKEVMAVRFVAADLALKGASWLQDQCRKANLVELFTGCTSPLLQCQFLVHARLKHIPIPGDADFMAVMSSLTRKAIAPPPT